MPRVTRRSLAAKEEPAPEESPRSTSRGRRSAAKKEEPKVEETAIDELQDVASKKGGRPAAKSKTPASKGRVAERGRSAARGSQRGKNVVEKDEEEGEEEEQVEAEEEEEQEEKPQGRGARSRGKGRGANAAKVEPSPTGRNSRSTRGKVTKEEEGSPEKEESKDEKSEDNQAASKTRGNRSRGKAKAETTPSPSAGRSSRRGRGVIEKEENEVKVEEESGEAEIKQKTPVKEPAEEKQTTLKESAAKKQTTSAQEPVIENQKPPVVLKEPLMKEQATTVKEPEVQKTPLSEEATPMKHSENRFSSTKETEGKSESHSQAEGKPEISADINLTSPSKTKESKEEAPKPEQDTEQPEDTEEAMETEDCAAVIMSATQKTECPENLPTPSKKRKLEENEEVAAKRAKTYESVSTEGMELMDYVMVEKDDVPSADSKEVLEAAPKLPPLLPKPPAEMSNQAAEEEQAHQPTDPQATGTPVVLEQGVPVVVPLTEAELAKQYTRNLVDREEASSTLVEVGSEGATDITGMSARSLDVSDAISMDSMSTVDDSSSSTSGLPLVVPSSVAGSNAGEATPAAAPALVQEQEQNIISASDVAPPPVHHNNIEQESQQQNNASAPALPAVVEIASSPAAQQSPVAATTPVVGVAPGLTQEVETNGTDSPVKQTIPATSPSKLSTSASLTDYIPSSTAIDCRKFVLNPAFPLELMDPAFCFSVVTYNILAECHWRRGDYSYTRPEHMELGYRHAMTLKELDYLDGDIVCLQEVEPHYYRDTLLPAMTSRGYSGWFIKRTKEYFDEGEATFVKNSRFHVKSSEGISLKDLAFKEVNESGLSTEVSTAAKEYLDRSDVMMLTQLECVKTGKILTVANIHVAYFPSAPDMQCIQVACSIKQLVSKAGSDLSPHIICGDFNSHVTTAGYQLAKDGYLSDDHIRRLQTVEALSNTDGSSRSLIHHMWRAFQHTSSNLKSAYEVTMGHEPLVTTFTKSQNEKCLDYVFFSSASLDTVGVLETLDEGLVSSLPGLPTASIPSDHLSLKAVFRIK